ncbi:MAG: sugar phosphate nucleotidyltransferase [Nanoarchaeota archaeon]
MKAVILAGGFGKRLRIAVQDVPKPMAPIAGKPFLEHQIRFLKDQGITEIVLCVYYMADKIKSYFGDGRKLGVEITYSDEEIPLGTGGALKKAEKYLKDDQFLVLNGDSYSQINVSALHAFHTAQKGIGTMCLTKAKNALASGNVFLKDGKITSFVEKQDIGSDLINSGVYLFQPDLFSYIPPNKNVSLEREIFVQLVKEGNLNGYPYDGYFIDIGLPETYSQFKQDVLSLLCIKEESTMREAMKKIERSGIPVLLIVDPYKKLLGTVTETDIKHSLLSGATMETEMRQVMNKHLITAKVTAPPEHLTMLFDLGVDYIPLLDESGSIKDISFYTEEIKTKSFPMVSGRTPLRISFGGGGTDLPYFFGKYGGAVINATINRYCYATIIKRADKKVIIDSDLSLENESVVHSINSLVYDGNMDLIKAAIRIMKPDFGFELYLHNDILPGRGLGSSASLAVLIISLLNHLQETNYDTYKIAELAYKVHLDELGIKGGWQDQYAAVTGGFNFMEFNDEKNIIYPLRLKEEVIHELNHRLLLCYVGKAHASTEVHAKQEESFKKNEEDSIRLLQIMKKIAIEVKDVLLTNKIDILGKLLHESWETKKLLSPTASTEAVDRLYQIGLNNGADGGRLLGAGNGGYLLFFYPPQKRNQLTRALGQAGGEIMNFNFEFGGTQVWTVKHKSQIV